MSPFETRNYYFYITKNEQGVKDLDYGDTIKEHLLQIPIKYEDINNLYDLIFALNDKLSLLIDVDEDEFIENDKLPTALKIAEEFYEKETDPEKKKSISIFVSVMKKAIELKRPLLIWW